MARPCCMLAVSGHHSWKGVVLVKPLQRNLIAWPKTINELANFVILPLLTVGLNIKKKSFVKRMLNFKAVESSIRLI